MIMAIIALLVGRSQSFASPRLHYNTTSRTATYSLQQYGYVYLWYTSATPHN
jgi:hypothetical protein